MSKPEKKIKRSVNFNAKEVSVLLSLVSKYKSKVECKQSDTNTNKIKALIWAKISEEFNSICGESFRDSKTLRNKYENVKKRSKSKFADEKVFAKGTGGGPSKDFITPTDNKIKDILGTQISGLSSEFDDDKEVTIPSKLAAQGSGIDEMPINNDIVSDMDILNSPVDILNTPSCSDDFNEYYCASGTPASSSQKESNTPKNLVVGDWSAYSPDKLRTPKAVPLKTSDARNSRIKTSNFTSNLLKWSTSKVEYTEVNKQYLEKEYQLKIKLLQERHDKILEIEERESREKMEMLQKEHEKRIEILELQKKKLLLDI